MITLLATLPFIGLATAGLVREYLFWRGTEPTLPQRCKKITVVIPMRGGAPVDREEPKGHNVTEG